NYQRREFVGEHGEQRRILRASAGDNKFLMGRVPSHNELADRIGDGAGGESGGSCDYVCFRGVAAAAHEVSRELASEFFTPGGLRRLLAEERRAQDASVHLFQGRTRGCDPATALLGRVE